MTKETHRDELKEFLKKMTKLLAQRLEHPSDLDKWYEQAQLLQNGLSPEIISIFPEIVWHYLEDADIRIKDPEYAKKQEIEVKDFLERLGHEKEQK